MARSKVKSRLLHDFAHLRLKTVFSSIVCISFLHFAVSKIYFYERSKVTLTTLNNVPTKYQGAPSYSF